MQDSMVFNPAVYPKLSTYLLNPLYKEKYHDVEELAVMNAKFMEKAKENSALKVLQ
jgi:predicted esterase YcpF (UPF0227 family)